MNGVKRTHRGFSIDRSTVKEIKLKAIQDNINDSRALDAIVSEWRDSRVEIEAYKEALNQKPAPIDVKLDEIEKSIDQILEKLKATRL